MIKDLILANRSCRRFQEQVTIDEKTLRDIVDLARLSASSANLQPLKYILSFDREKNQSIFPHLAWAGYLKDWPGPAEGERPAAYIVILLDTDIQIKAGCDHGIAAQSILLGATERGLGGCIIGSIKRKSLRAALDIPEKYEILLIIALGKPGEKIVIDQVRDGDVKYWRDDQDRHHVPKRTLDEIILDSAARPET